MMNALFVFAILFVSAVLSSPVPKNPTGMSLPGDTDFDDWKKLFPEVKIPRHNFNFPAVKDQFWLPSKDVFDDDSDDMIPQTPLFLNRNPENFFKTLREKFLPKNATNNTVENTREVDGHVIHEKESTYSNGDANSHVVIRQKTVIIRPKVGAVDVDHKSGVDRPSTKAPKPVEVVPKVDNPNRASNRNNPDEDVEMQPKKVSQNAAIHEGNSIDNSDFIVDLSKDTRINDFYNGPIEPKAILFDVKARKISRENPNAPIRELNTNDLNEEVQPLPISLEHDTDVNTNTAQLETEEDAEIIDTNAIRRKRKNKYMHNT